MELTQLHFLRPWWLLALLPLASVIYFWARQRSDNRWRDWVRPALLEALIQTGGRTAWFGVRATVALVLALLIVGLSGPAWERQSSPFAEDQSALVIALEVSPSMLQTDVQPSRLARAKHKIEDLLALRATAKTALVVFSGSAHTVIPLTSDPDILRQFLNAIDVQMMPKAGNAPEKLLPLLKPLLGHLPSASLLVIGDGLGANSVAAFEQYFASAPQQLLVLATGSTENALVPLESNRLRVLANRSGGSFHTVTVDSEDVIAINKRINRHFARVGDSDRPWVDAGYFLLFPAALGLLLCFRRGWLMSVCLATLIAINPATSPAVAAAPEQTEERGLAAKVGQWFLGWWLTPDQLGRFYFERGQYAQAATHFQQPLWRAAAAYYGEDFEAAALIYEDSSGAKARYNQANALAHAQGYVAAVTLYNQVLNEIPEQASALGNRNLVQQIIDEINRLSESQQAEGTEAFRELGDAPQRGDGAEQTSMLNRSEKTLEASQLLADKAIFELWMRQVQQDPARFLRVKFQQQLNSAAADE